MDPPGRDFWRLRQELARLYPHAATIRRVAWDAGIVTERLELSGPADDIWYGLLEEAQRQKRVEQLLEVAQREYPNAALGSLLPRDLYGEPIWQGEHGRVYALKVDAPWTLPVEALTLPSAPGSLVTGDLVDALFAKLDEAPGEQLRRLLRRALQSDPLTPATPRLVPIEGAGIDGIVPRAVFLACANTPKDAARSAELICKAAGERNLSSVAIPMVGSGRGGLNSAEVARAIFHAVRMSEERGATPPVVVLTTRDDKALEAMHMEAHLGFATPTSVPPAAAVGKAPPVATSPSPEPAIDDDSPPAPPSRTRTELWLTIDNATASWSYPDDLPIWSHAVGSPWVHHPLAEPARLHALALDATADDVRAYGDELSYALFGGPAPTAVVDALRTIAGAPPLRMVFDLDALAACIPWEYLRVDGVFLLERNVSLVRHVASAVAPRPLTVPAPLQHVVLAVAAPFDAGAPSAGDEFYFDTEGHRAELEKGLYGARVAVVRGVSQCSERKLSEALAAGGARLDTLHFLGHGRRLIDPPTLVVHDHADPSAPADLTGQRLAELLTGTRARLVFLGACHSGGGVPGDPFAGIAHAVVRTAGVPVVAMQFAVPQGFSTAFAATFYGALAAHGGDLEVAVAHARRAVCEGRHAFGIPTLFADVKAAPAEVPALPPPATWSFAPVRLTVDARSVAEALKEIVPGVAESVLATIAASPKDLPSPPRGATPEAKAAYVKRVYREAGGTDEGLLADVLAALRPAPVAPLAPLELKTSAHVIEAHDDRALRADWPRLRAAVADVAARYVLPEPLLARIASELLAERHVLLVGPVGTGKTSLALELTEALGYAPLIATASADWSAHDVIGGFWPVPAGGGTRFTFRPGVFTEAVLANWNERAVKDGRAHWDRRPDGGCWLVLDELNRADMDRAMGAVFTALETRRLRVPMGDDARGASVEVPLPRDFRVLATINGADRHHLFRLSDALRRRFAFVEVPDTLDFKREEDIIKKRLGETPLGASTLSEHVLRFVRLARAVHPLGTAQVIAATRFLHASEGSGLDDRARVAQALLGAVVPTLETAGEDVARLLARWARGATAEEIAQALRKGRWRGNRIASVGSGLGSNEDPHDAVATLALPKDSSYPELAARLEAIADEYA